MNHTITFPLKLRGKVSRLEGLDLRTNADEIARALEEATQHLDRDCRDVRTALAKFLDNLCWESVPVGVYIKPGDLVYYKTGNNRILGVVRREGNEDWKPGSPIYFWGTGYTFPIGSRQASYPDLLTTLNGRAVAGFSLDGEAP